jgi:hypothetical protein
MSTESATLNREQLETMVREGLKATTGRVRHCAFHALHHLERAKAIASIDPEMALFRAITAEEEAATAVFLSLLQRRYPRADQLQIKSHLYKLGLYPFISKIYNFLASMSGQFPPMRLNLIEEAGKSLLVWEFQTPDGRWAMSDPPLNVQLSTDLNLTPYRFDHQLEELKGESVRGEIKRLIEQIANQRNTLLYADDAGIPAVTAGVEETLENQRKRVLRLCLLVCMVAPYKEHAIFVQQVLDAFLHMMGKIDEETFSNLSYGPAAREKP